MEEEKEEVRWKDGSMKKKNESEEGKKGLKRESEKKKEELNREREEKREEAGGVDGCMKGRRKEGRVD